MFIVLSPLPLLFLNATRFNLHYIANEYVIYYICLDLCCCSMLIFVLSSFCMHFFAIMVQLFHSGKVNSICIHYFHFFATRVQLPRVLGKLFTIKCWSIWMK